MGAGEGVAEARRLVYRVLSALFLYPDEDRVAALAAALPEVRAGTAPLAGLAVFPAWQDLLARVATLARDGEELRAEYTALFLAGGAASCPPYESAHVSVDPAAAPSVATAVERAYARAGLAVGGAAAGELPDHVAVELDFLSYLCGVEAEAPTADAAARCRGEQLTFLRGHLLRWLPRFAAAVARAAPGGTYREVAGVARAFAEHDLLLLEALRAAG